MGRSAWDQNAAMYAMSPAVAVREEVCEMDRGAVGTAGRDSGQVGEQKCDGDWPGWRPGEIICCARWGTTPVGKAVRRSGNQSHRRLGRAFHGLNACR